jgi:molecular chaperone GrpE
MFPELDNEEVDGGREAKCRKKVAELEASLQEKTRLEELYLNQIRYARADLENFQRHKQKHVTEEVTREKAKLIIQILPVVEDVDLILAEAQKARNPNLSEGIEMIRKKLWKVLNCEGISSIDAMGKPFDPHMHDALQEIETCDCPEGTVVQEIRKGYLLKGKVFRPSLVKVSCSPASGKVKKVN